MIILKELDFLINYLLKENTEIKIDKLPTNIIKKKNLYRSLCNIRKPKTFSKEYINIENDYLQEELNKKNITNIDDILPISTTIKNSNLKNKNKICLWKGDITTLKIDSIVNAANSQGLGCFIPCHKCIDNQIHSSAGIKLRLECNKIMKEKNYFLHTGKSFITKGYNLPSKYIIHTVGPIIQTNVTEKEEIQLVNCYTSSLELALKNRIKSIAFPCISTGEYRFPKEKACKLAILAVENFLEDHNNDFDKIIFNVYEKEDYEIYERNIR